MARDRSFLHIVVGSVLLGDRIHALPYLRIVYPHGVVQIEVRLEGVCNSSNLLPWKEVMPSAPRLRRYWHCLASVYERYPRRGNYSGGIKQSKNLANSSSVVNVLCRRLIWRRMRCGNSLILIFHWNVFRFSRARCSTGYVK